jgi:hypothetical protein
MIKEIRTDEIFVLGVKSFATTALENLADVHDAIIEVWSFQSNNANKKEGTNLRSSQGTWYTCRQETSICLRTGHTSYA